MTDGAQVQTGISQVEDMYRSKGVGVRLGFGQRAAVLIVDFQQVYTRTWRAKTQAPLAQASRLLGVARGHGCPVFYTYVGYDPDQPDGGIWATKAPTLLENLRGSWNCQIDPLVAPHDGDVVIEKRAPSSFFGTGLHERLRSLAVDTVVTCGTSLSGCVRATVVDGLSYQYRMVVPEECVMDPSPPSLATSLMEIRTKYGDVVSADEAIAGILSSQRVLT